jgi:hypothetical protein
MSNPKIKRKLIEMPYGVFKVAEKRRKKNRRSLNAQIVHDVEMANNLSGVLLDGASGIVKFRNNGK